MLKRFYSTNKNNINPGDVILTTLSRVPGKKLLSEKGFLVEAKGDNILNYGGRLKHFLFPWTSTIAVDTFEEATNKLRQSAAECGCNAVLGMKYSQKRFTGDRAVIIVRGEAYSLGDDKGDAN
ncbi:hypothetical protein AKO1_012748 [Acrasis kona]|uniref:Heavy metal-binding domain-containing protein n=1 Tax=Acrasis kona TaxID=1008807 RepID=A0AAW2YXE5_9EUKA